AFRHSGVALLLLQEPPDRSRPLPRARPLHPADQAEEHLAVADGRGADHPPRDRVLRKGVTLAQYIVTAVGLAAIAGVLWYFLFSRGSAVVAQQTGAGGVQEVRILVKGGYTPDTVVVQAGKPVRLQFYRDETADCSERDVCDRDGGRRLRRQTDARRGADQDRPLGGLRLRQGQRRLFRGAAQ